MNILERIRQWAEETPDKIAVRSGERTLTYEKLMDYSDRLAAWILEHESSDAEPVAVYGHKNPWMLVCFLACVKSGRAYCPVDHSVPDARVEMILKELHSGIVFATEEMDLDTGDKDVIGLKQMMEIGMDQAGEKPSFDLPMNRAVCGDETFYIIFTSGSTGTPKGVQISADCLNHYLDWSVTLGNTEKEKLGKVFLNQAPFSFDLSVMDLYTSLACGGTLFCLEKSAQTDYRALMRALSDSGANVWVSTPSFAEICLSDPSFNGELLPGLQTFLFCGETLANRTVKKLAQRFPEAVVVNTYGPTESTVAVTEVTVTREMVEQQEPLPVGKAKPGTRIQIWDNEGNILPDGEKGEIIILGNTVSTGYFGRRDLTEKAFFEKPCGENKEKIRGYHTGDKGYLMNGMLYYCGRIDLQIKLHGYRIELEDIENNIRRLNGIEHSVVLPNVRDGKVKSLSAFVVDRIKAENERERTSQLKQELLGFVPDYMVPKKFIYLDQMPMTDNGKADRKSLGGWKG